MNGSRAPLRVFLASSFGLLASCGAGGGAGNGGAPITDQGAAPEIVFIRSQIARPGSGTEIRSATTRGLSDTRPLVDRPGIETDIRVSPDGTRVVFARERTPGDPLSREIYVADLGSPTSEERITADREIDDSPCWSSDGTRVLFSSTRGNTGRRIWSVNPDSPSGSFETVFDDGTEQNDPDARGDLIVFSRVDPTTERAGIWLINTRTGARLAITDGGSGDAFGDDAVPGDFEPTISPDLGRMLFTRSLGVDQRVTMQTNLFIFGPATPFVPVSTAPREDRRPRITADDSVFVARRDPSAEDGGSFSLIRLVGAGTVALFADKRFDSLGFDVLPAFEAEPTAFLDREADLSAPNVTVERAFGLGSSGNPLALSTDDGVVLSVFTATAAGGRQAAGLRLRIPLPGVTEATDIEQIQFEARAAISRIDGDTTLRLTSQDLLDNRNDTLLELTPSSTELQSIEFATQNLSYVSREGTITFTLIADLPPGDTAELAIDRITVRVLETVEPSDESGTLGG